MREKILPLASLAMWAAALVCLALLVRADNSSIAITRVAFEAFDEIPNEATYLVEGHPDIAEITRIAAIDDEKDLIALGRWVRSRMILDLDADPLPADPIRAIDRAAAAPVRGYCSHYSLLTIAAAHAFGLPARVVQVNGHATSAVHFEGKWRVLDAYFNVTGEGSTLELIESGDLSTLRKCSASVGNGIFGRRG